MQLGEDVGREFVEEWQPTDARWWDKDLERAIPTQSARAQERGLYTSEEVGPRSFRR